METIHKINQMTPDMAIVMLLKFEFLNRNIFGSKHLSPQKQYETKYIFHLRVPKLPTVSLIRKNNIRKDSLIEPDGI